MSASCLAQARINHGKISLVVKNHSEREDMTTFIMDYTRKELHYSAKCHTFLIPMLAFSSKVS